MRAAVLHVPQRERLVAPQESSPLKRKYNGDGETQVQLRLRLIKNINCIGLLNAKSGFLFPSGDVLLKSRPGVVLIRDVVNLAEQDDHSLISETDHGVESVPSMCALNNLEGGWRELVGASRDGRVFSAVIDDDGHTTTMLHEDLLGADKSPDDLVTAIYHAGDCYVLGTDRSEIFVVSREGLAASVFKLQRAQGLYSIVRSGAAFLWGYAEPREEPTQGRRGVVSIFSLPSNGADLLLSVCAEKIELWADWSQSRGHKIFWERDLREIVSDNIRQVLCQAGPVPTRGRGKEGAVTAWQALDSLLLPLHRSSSVTSVSTIAVLSACAMSSTEVCRAGGSSAMCEGDICSLWVHVIEVSVSGDGGNHVIRGQFLVESGMLPASCGWVLGGRGSADALPSLLPRLHLPKSSGRGASSNDLYVSWESVGTKLCLANCDLDALDSDGSIADTYQTPCCVYATDICTSNVLSINVIESLLLKDGVSIVLKDGAILHASACPLPFSAPRLDRSDMGATLGDAAERVELLLACSQEVIVTADVAEAQQSSHMVLEDGTSLLPQFSVMPLSSSCNDQISRLRLFFAGASEEEAAQCAVVASTTICQRLPVGHSWGEEILQFGAEDGAAADYGIVRTSLREKCISHMKLIWVLLSTRAWDFFPSIRRDISRHHSFLKSCLGMCLSLTESQSKKQKQVGVSGGIAWFLSTGHEHMLEAVVDGMVAAVNLMPEMDEFTALGLRTVDSFFSQTLQLPRGLYCIAKALSAKGTELHRCDSLVPSAYAMLSICLSVLQAGDSKVLAPKQRADVISSHSPSSEYLSSEFPSSVSFSNDVRAAVGCTLQCMRTGLSLQLAEGPLSARSKYLQKAGWRREVEGHRVISLCTALLQSFSVELGLFAETQLTSEQKRRLDIAYNEAKDVCIDVLFLLGHAADAFDLASKFTHFRGLLEANEQDKSLNPSLYCTVKDYGKSVDPTDGCTPLGLFALHFFKERNQVSMIIEYSKVIDKVQLCTFFADHPQLAWICSILRNSGDAGFDMQESARASLLHSQACTDLATAKTLISISKLCSVVSMSSYQNNDESTEESVYQCAVSNLAVIRAQEVVKDARSDVGNARLGAKDLCDSLMDYIRQLLSAKEDKSHEDLRDTVISVCAAALVVVAELLSEDAWNEQKLVDLWALVMEYDQSLWYGLLGHDVDVLIEGLNVNSLKDTVVATLSKIARGDVELGKLSHAVLLNFKDGYFLKKSACAFFDKIQENNGPRRKQLMHLIAMAVR